MARKKTHTGETQEQYRARIMEIVCEEIANSDRSIWDICEDNSELPTSRTIFNWLAVDDTHFQMYARARLLQADFLAAQIRKIADECRIGTKTVSRANREEITTGDMVERSRLQIDVRKWLASKLAPAKYGDRITTEHTGKISLIDLLSEDDPSVCG